MSESSGQGVHRVARDNSRSLSATDDQNVSSLLSSSAWKGTNITFSFPNSSADYGTQAAYGDPAPFNGFAVLTGQQQGEVLRAFSLISSYTNETFTNITETTTTHAAIRLANSSSPPTSYAFYPSTAPDGGDVFYGGTGQHPVMGNFDSGQATLHEIGHSLGLKHGQDNNTYGVMNANRLDIEFSLMNYPNYIGSTEGFATAAQSPQSYMMYDIAAFQYMYGANFTQVGHNNIYTWSATTGTEFINGVSQGTPVDNHIFETVWTEGASSTYDLSNFSQNQVDDMNPGGWMDFSTSQLADLNAFAPSKPQGEIFARADVYNALEYNGDSRSLIDNIITGSGNDTIIGNAANNVVDGGGGTNTFVETGNHTNYNFKQLNTGYIQITDLRPGSPDGTDQIKNIQKVQFADGTYTISQLLPPVDDSVSETVPSSLTATVGVSQTISGISVTDADASTFGETFTVDVSAVSGLIFGSSIGGASVAGSGTHDLIITGTGSVSQLNAALAELSYTNSVAGTDTITVKTSDSDGSPPVTKSFGVNTAAGQPDVAISALPNLSGYGTLGTGDFNDDGFSSIVLQNKSNGQMEIWYMGNGQIVADYHYGNLSGYAMLGSGDFNGDGTSDIVWQNRSTGQAEIWSMKNGAVIADTPIGNLSGYGLIGTGDFTGSGTSDMVWQNRSTGQADIWIMSNNHLAADIPLGNLGGYSLIGTADLNGDHQTDLIWQNASTGAVDVWFMGNGHLVADYAYGNLSGYKLLATGDINQDGTTALLWQNKSTGELSDWNISPQTGTPISFQSFGVQPLNFQETASGHNSDGSPDVLWQDPKTGQTQIWNFSHTNAQGTAASLGAVAAASGGPSGFVSQGSSIAAAGNDTFVFQPGFGAPVVADGRSTDTAVLDGISSLAKNDQLAALLDEGRIGQSQTLFDGGHDTTINLADHDSMTTTRVAALHASDFIIH